MMKMNGSSRASASNDNHERRLQEVTSRHGMNEHEGGVGVTVK